MAKKINYVGWLGHKNFGDEALYFAIAKLLAPYALHPYNSYSFVSFFEDRLIPVFESASSHVSVFGGGTLLPDDVTWVKPARYNYLFGAAVKDPNFVSKFHDFDDVTISRLKNFDFRLVGVRENFSRQMLRSWGIKSEVIGDPVLSLEPSPGIRRDKSKIALNVGCDGELWGGNQKHVVVELAGVCNTLKERGFDLVVVPLSEQDVPYAEMLSRKTNVPVFGEWVDPQSVLDFVASCHLLIGERLHSLAISAATCTPFVSLEYRPKCRAFSDSVGFSKFCLRTDNLNTKRVLEMVEDLLNNWGDMQLVLKAHVSGFREKQKVFSKYLLADLASLPTGAWTVSRGKEVVKRTLFWDTDVAMRKTLARFWREYNRLVFLRVMRHLL
jgi:exopolysaccharide biosynthesis predicted pyruvyltransferase EpsI